MTHKVPEAILKLIAEGYLTLFYNGYLYLYHPSSGLSVRTKGNTYEELVNTTTFEPTEMPKDTTVEIWEGAMKCGASRITTIVEDYGSVENWCEQKQKEFHVGVKFILGLWSDTYR